MRAEKPFLNFLGSLSIFRQIDSQNEQMHCAITLFSMWSFQYWDQILGELAQNMGIFEIF